MRACDQPANTLENRPRRRIDAPRSRAHGGRQRAGLQAPGTALRGRPRLLRDGELRGHRARKRAHARISACRGGRAPARDPALRLRATDARERGQDGRGRRRGHRRPQLRLSRAEGDEDGRGSDAARRSRSRLPDRRDGGRGRRRPRHREAPSGAPERLARLSRARSTARRVGCGVADAPPPLGGADVYGDRGPLAHRGARVARRRPGRRVRRCHLTGAEAVMVGRGAQGNPWALREIVDGDDSGASREEIVAELVLFAREAVRELGERKASGFLKKFYGWYLGGGRFAKQFRQELLQLDSTEEVERRLLAAEPGAIPLLERLEADVPKGEEVTLELPVSIYGGG